MKGSEAKMMGFMEGADKRFVIPVYQRKYDWKYDNCRQLYEDLKKSLSTDKRVISLAALFLRLYLKEAKSNTISLTASNA